MIEENKIFIDFYESLLPHEQKFFKSQVMLACETSLQTIEKWLKGNVRIRNPYRDMINRIAGRELFPTVKLMSLAKNV